MSFVPRVHEAQPLFPEPHVPLRLYSDDVPQPQQQPAAIDSSTFHFSPQMKMRQWVEEIIRQESPAKGTSKRWRNTVGHWERITLDPTIEKTNQAVCDRFYKGLQADPNQCNNTRRIHGVQLTGFLNRLGPPTKRHRRAVHFYQRPPWVDLAPLEVIEGKSKRFTLAEQGRYLDALKDLPKQRKPFSAAPFPLLCECAALVDYNTGLRITELLSMRLEWLDRDEDWQWVDMPASVMKRGKQSGRGRRVPLNKFALAAIDRLRPYLPPRGPIFGGKEFCQRHDRARLAGLARAGLPQVKRLGFHGLRQEGAYRISKINPNVKKLFLGHSAGRDTTEDFYTPWVELAEALQNLPQPSWTAWCGRNQLRLFD